MKGGMRDYMLDIIEIVEGEKTKSYQVNSVMLNNKEVVQTA